MSAPRTLPIVPTHGAARRRPGAGTRARALDAWWVELLRMAAGAVFPALVLFAVLEPWLAGRVFWTVAVASLPLIFVLAGYHRWRRICPLAFVAQIPALTGHAGQRRAGRWLQAHAYHVTFGIFVACLWLRLVATNGDGYALAAFLVLLCLAAVGVGLVYTGKTWCNYVCPISFVEKLYTEPRGLRDTPNSQCETCTACRPSCPDINEENSYWKEVLSPAKRHVYYAFPGVVLAFYAYYYLQSGGWDYYFGGAWTNEVGLVRTAFLPGRSPLTAGLWFAPAVPRALAAAITLAAGGAAAFAALAVAEPALGRLLERRGLAADEGTRRSVMFAMAAFTAFVAFYTFAGAPTLRLVTGLSRGFQVVVVATATLFLVRRIGRRQATFAEESLARKIIASWKWDDMPAPRDLREAFLIHTIRSRSHDEARQQVLDLYRVAVQEGLESGVVSRGEVHRLDALRAQLQISDADHERVMTELADERGGMAGARAAASPEKQLQLDTYAEALSLHVERDRTEPGAVDDRFVAELRERYGVTLEEHAAVVERLVEGRDGLQGRLGDLPAAIEWSAAAVARLQPARSQANRFLLRLLRRRWTRAAERLVRTIASETRTADALRDGLLALAADDRDLTLGVLGAQVSTATARRLAEAVERARAALGAGELPVLLRLHLSSPDPYLRAAALYLLQSLDAATAADFDRLAADEHPIVRETAACARAAASGELAGTSTLEKMLALQAVGIFDDLEPEDLAQLARSGVEIWFREGETLCAQGAVGDDVFVILDGEVSVVQADAGGSRALGVEGPGGCIGELAVLDPAPREATVVAATIAVRTLRLTGDSFRQAISMSPAVSEAVIRILARRLRRALPGARPTPATIP